MTKKQWRHYAKKFEGASDAVRLAMGLLVLIGFWKLMDFFVTGTSMAIAGGLYAVAVAGGYWWCRRQWRLLLAPLPPASKPSRSASALKAKS